MEKAKALKVSSSVKSSSGRAWVPRDHYNKIWSAVGGVKRLGATKAFLAAAPSPDTPLEQGFTALMLCAMKGDCASMKELVDAGADVEARSGSGQTALMLAAVCEAKGALRWLLARGADAKASDNDGDDVLMRGIHGDMDILCDLVDAGADPKATCRGRSKRSYLRDCSIGSFGFGVNESHKIDALDAFFDKNEIKSVLEKASKDELADPAPIRQPSRL